jgi:hypothetical protein
MGSGDYPGTVGRPGTAPLPPAAVIEIVERGLRTDDTAGGSIVVPDEVRINGQALLVAQHGIKIHEMELGGPADVVRVTLTLFARRVVIGAEHDIDGDAP